EKFQSQARLWNFFNIPGYWAVTNNLENQYNYYFLRYNSYIKLLSSDCQTKNNRENNTHFSAYFSQFLPTMDK
ncbi:hypothetical protein, partial [Streptococcus himalayensis]|uniref:hypothetical protein n=1 Tax=Streptococcus himalayensis TaxID=1888195 RepID=UPI001E5EFDB4